MRKKRLRPNYTELQQTKSEKTNDKLDTHLSPKDPFEDSKLHDKCSGFGPIYGIKDFGYPSTVKMEHGIVLLNKDELANNIYNEDEHPYVCIYRLEDYIKVRKAFPLKAIYTISFRVPTDSVLDMQDYDSVVKAYAKMSLDGYKINNNKKLLRLAITVKTTGIKLVRCTQCCGHPAFKGSKTKQFRLPVTVCNDSTLINILGPIF